MALEDVRGDIAAPVPARMPSRLPPPRRPGRPPRQQHPTQGPFEVQVEEDEGPLVDPGRPLGLRILALLGAFSFVMLGLSSLALLLQRPAPPPMPDQRGGPISRGV